MHYGVIYPKIKLIRGAKLHRRKNHPAHHGKVPCFKKLNSFPPRATKYGRLYTRYGVICRGPEIWPRFFVNDDGREEPTRSRNLRQIRAEF